VTEDLNTLSNSNSNTWIIADSQRQCAARPKKFLKCGCQHDGNRSRYIIGTITARLRRIHPKRSPAFVRTAWCDDNTRSWRTVYSTGKIQKAGLLDSHYSALPFSSAFFSASAGFASSSAFSAGLGAGTTGTTWIPFWPNWICWNIPGRAPAPPWEYCW